MGKSSERLTNNAKTSVSTAKCWRCCNCIFIHYRDYMNEKSTEFNNHSLLRAQISVHSCSANDVRGLSESSSCIWLGLEAQLLLNQRPWNLVFMETILKVFTTFEVSATHRYLSQNIQGARCPQHLWVTLSCHFPMRTVFPSSSVMLIFKWHGF